MSRDAVMSMFDAVDRQDWARLARFYCDDCYYERPGFIPISGHTELMRFYEEIRPIARGDHRLTLILQDGDVLCAAGEFRGLLRTGRQVDLQFADLYRMRDGLIHTRKTFFFTPLV